MATRKLKLRKSTRSRNSRYLTAGRRRKTVRRRRSSTAGKILPPLDVRTPRSLKEFEKRIKKGPITIILVYADWCGHCHTMMPHFDAAAKSPSRSIQAVKVNEQMLSDVNSVVNKSINKSAQPLNVEGYPSIILVDNKANKITDLEPIRSTETMTKIMSQAGPLANQAGINISPQANSIVKSQVKNIVSNKPISINNAENMVALTAKPNTNAIKKNTLMTNIGAEDVGLASGIAASPRNIDVGEQELKGSIASEINKNKGFNLKSIKTNNMAEAGVKKNLPRESIKEAAAPSSLDMFNEPTTETTVRAPSGNINKEAEEVTSLASPLSPPTTSSDIEEKSISNSLTPEQKIGGGRRGGSLYASMAKATYAIAPAAALLATAAMVTKNRHNRTRKTRKSMRHRR